MLDLVEAGIGGRLLKFNYIFLNLKQLNGNFKKKLYWLIFLKNCFLTSIEFLSFRVYDTKKFGQALASCRAVLQITYICKKACRFVSISVCVCVCSLLLKHMSKSDALGPADRCITQLSDQGHQILPVQYTLCKLFTRHALWEVKNQEPEILSKFFKIF